MSARPARPRELAAPAEYVPALSWKMGLEVELLAPPGQSREALADAVAARIGGRVERFFHPQSEPSKVPGKPTFENLTPGFRVLAADGSRYASFVDDVTIKHTLDPRRPPLPGWYRIVSDDSRLLQLVAEHCDASAPLAKVLEPFAKLFGTPLDSDRGMFKVSDRRNVSIAIGAPMPGERERPCEIVTAPLATRQRETLELLLSTARAAGYALPREGATHIHFDAAPLAHPVPFARLVKLLARHGPELRRLLGTNPYCVRLGNWKPELEQLVRHPEFAGLTWAEARASLRLLELTKYCDFNLINLIEQNPQKLTFEVRILPASLDAGPILQAAALFEAILRWCVEPTDKRRSTPADLPRLFSQVLSKDDAKYWTQKYLEAQLSVT